jgi:hypothetical protein
MTKHTVPIFSKSKGLQKVDILEEISHGGNDEDEEDFEEF